MWGEKVSKMAAYHVLSYPVLCLYKPLVLFNVFWCMINFHKVELDIFQYSIEKCFTNLNISAYCFIHHVFGDLTEYITFI